MKRRGLFALLPALVVTRLPAPAPTRLELREIAAEFWSDVKTAPSLFYDATRRILDRKMRSMGARYVVNEDIYVERDTSLKRWHHAVIWEVA